MKNFISIYFSKYGMLGVFSGVLGYGEFISDELCKVHQRRLSKLYVLVDRRLSGRLDKYLWLQATWI